ncbi:MAG: hypothetical protein K8L97_26995 [Anaerolineae bacterium]|nr:hypothetical protein [Anaerolineae bacterium]
MSVSAFWDNNRQLMRLAYTSTQPDWGDLQAALEETKGFLVRVSRPVAVVVEIGCADMNPTEFMAHCRELANLKDHAMVSALIIVGADLFAQALYKSTNAGLRARDLFQFAATLEDVGRMLPEISTAIKPGSRLEHWEFILSLSTSVEQPKPLVNYE